MYCRGGPPWPPLVGHGIQDSIVSDLADTISTEGGHGGPPLQYVPEGDHRSEARLHLNQSFWSQSSPFRCYSEVIHS